MIAAIATESVALSLGGSTPVPFSDTSIPVVSVEPEAKFVAAGGRKPASSIEWSASHLVAEELATTIAIRDAFIEDAGYPVWANVKARVASALARAFDNAVLFGTGGPASYPVGGIAAVTGAAITGVDALDAIDS
jgi:HK97 family phage major capsid protein